MARIIGRDAMPARQRLTLLCAQLVNQCFLRQSAYSEIDRQRPGSDATNNVARRSITQNFFAHRAIQIDVAARIAFDRNEAQIN